MSHRHNPYHREHSQNSNDSREERGRKKRKSRWGNDESDKVVIPGLPTIIPSNLTKEQEEMYLLQVQIESITHKLRTSDLGIPEDIEQRSPSPEPVYNSEGKRLNTREFRVRKKLEEERHQLITQMLALNSLYKAPLDYKPPQTKLSDKVLIPQEDYPDINFVGLLIGPRGNTLKSMEKDTGAKIIIRGKGSIKEGKIGRKDGQPLPGEDEPLHAFLTAPTEESIQAATKQIMKIIRQAIELPENQNNLRRTQLRELALLNGTLRENDSLSKRFCSNCGSVEHRNWQCPEKQNMVNIMHCSKCNGKGHLEKDCKFGSENGVDAAASSSKIDEEYYSFMAELGECSPPSAKSKNSVQSAPVATNSTTTAADGGPMALTYEKSANESQNNSDSNQASPTNGNVQALLPTPAARSHGRPDKGKNVTWIQKQGSWKQVVKDPSDNSSNDRHNSSSEDPSTTENVTPAPSMTPEHLTKVYYDYLQQALAAGQDYPTAMATAQQYYEAYVAHAVYAASSAAAVPTQPVDSNPSSSKYSQASYNAVPPTSQLGNASSSTAISSGYGYGVMPNASQAANYSSYAAYYQSLAQPPLPDSQPPPPPE